MKVSVLPLFGRATTIALLLGLAFALGFTTRRLTPPRPSLDPASAVSVIYPLLAAPPLPMPHLR